MTPVRCSTMKAITRAAMTMVTTIVVVRLPPGGGESRPDGTGWRVCSGRGSVTADLLHFRRCPGEGEEPGPPPGVSTAPRWRQVVIGLPEPCLGRAGGQDPPDHVGRQREDLLRPSRRHATGGPAGHRFQPVAAAGGQQRRGGTVPGAATDEGVTGASVAAIRPGRVIVTSVRPPCRVVVPVGQGRARAGVPAAQGVPVPGPAHQGTASVPWSSCSGRRRDQPR